MCVDFLLEIEDELPQEVRVLVHQVITEPPLAQGGHFAKERVYQKIKEKQP
jgi:hypothetical protein